VDQAVYSLQLRRNSGSNLYRNIGGSSIFQDSLVFKKGDRFIFLEPRDKVEFGENKYYAGSIMLIEPFI